MGCLFLWAVATIAGLNAGIILFNLGQALLGHLLGIRVEVVAIGYCKIWKWQGKHWQWRIGLFPLGGYTKFVGTNQDRDGGDPSMEAPEGTCLPEPLPEGSFLAASPATRVATLFSGPLVQMGSGLVLLVLGALPPGQQMTLRSDGETLICPTSVPGLALGNRPTSWESQAELVEDISWQWFRKFLLFRPLENWGGYFAFFATCVAAGCVSPSAWLTCMGLLMMVQGAANLLPIPNLNGGHILQIVVSEVMLGRTMPARPNTAVACVGLLVLLIFHGRVLWADVAWLWNLLGG